MTMTADAAHALSRFGLGARPGERADIASDPKGWVDEQLGRSLDSAIIDRDFQSTVDVAQLQKEIQALHLEEFFAREDGDIARAEEISAELEVLYEQVYTGGWTNLAARVEQGARTATPVKEKLVRFWTNHFTVSSRKDSTELLAAPFEREVIRSNIDGSFYQMLKAVQQSPGMLIYLDNWMSIGPNSRVGRREGDVGINENLAREILELHTIGVNGGYTQADVTEFALAITGWTAGFEDLATRQRTGKFFFKRNFHEPGPRTVRGITYAAGNRRQGEAILQDLARDPATANFVATKLVRHFVSDQPPVGAVAEVAQVFLDTDGDLPSVHAAVLGLDDAWSQPFAKARKSEEHVIAMLRAAEPNHSDFPYRWLPALLADMGHPVFGPPGPNGWPDIAPYWLSGNSVLRRAEMAQAFWWTGDYGGAEVMMDDLYGPLLTADTRSAIRAAEEPEMAMAVALASFEMSYA